MPNNRGLKRDERVASLARTVVVRDIDALMQIAAADDPLSIVCTSSPGNLVQRATRSGHRVLIPHSRGEGLTGTLKIPRLSRQAAECELKAMGLPSHRAHELAVLARRSLLALRRRLAANAAIARPAWASSDIGRSYYQSSF